MFAVTHHVIPSAGNDDPAIGGAYAVGFINHTDDAIAVQMAKDAIDDQWTIKTLDSVNEVQRTDYEPGDRNLELFDQALIDTVVTTFYVYPPGTEEQKN